MKRYLVPVVLSLALAGPAVAETTGDAEAQSKLPTFFRLLVGHPDPAPGSESVLVVPGTVVSSAGLRSEPAADVLKVIDELKAAYRLGSIEIASSQLVPFSASQAASIAAVPGGPEISATMLDFDDKAATLKISLTENGKVLAEPTIRELRGGRAVIGARNGPAAPYVFLLVEPLPGPVGPKRTGSAALSTGELTGPRLVKKTQPAYPDEARKARLEGLVVLDCTIGADGRVKGCTASRREPMGLTEAAIGAVAQWEFEPARDASGQAVEVIMTFTIRFALA